MNRIRQMSTRMEVQNNGSKYPSVMVKWTEDSDFHGWTGKLSLWKNGNEREEGEHTINIRQTMPLGGIVVMFDEVAGAGCWEHAYWDGATITERDLQWATAWGLLAKKSKDKAMSHD